jgi:hypothetical protein
MDTRFGLCAKRVYHISRVNTRMQNIDFYEGNPSRPQSPQFDRQDMEYFSRMSSTYVKDEEHVRNKASRLMFIIGALCIISFTTGMVVGLKFAGGANKEIVDDRTYNAVKGIGEKMTGLLGDKKVHAAGAVSYPKSEYPYVIRIEEKIPEMQARDSASFLSSQGHTVILTRNMDRIDMYTGPYKNITDAKKSLKIIEEYPAYANTQNLKILKRK